MANYSLKTAQNGEKDTLDGRSHHKRGLLGGVNMVGAFQVTIQEEASPQREPLVHLPPR